MHQPGQYPLRDHSGPGYSKTLEYSAFENGPAQIVSLTGITVR
jgi:hypothetical protein